LLTDDAGQCARARRILAPRWPNIIMDSCKAHQLNLFAKDVFKISMFSSTISLVSSMISVLNRATAKWLPLLNERLVQVYGRSLSLIRMTEVRWNSAHAACASLLRIRSGFQSFVQMNRHKRNFLETLTPAAEQEFWDSLVAAEAVIRPLSYANLSLQK